MRILKNIIDNILVAIAGEMLNIETSTFSYLNGQLLTAAERPLDMFDGYPRVIHDNIIDKVRAVSGYIYVPVGTNLSDFENKLVHQLLSMEHTIVNPKGCNIAPLGAYQSINTSHCTNIKAVSFDGRTIKSSNNEKYSKNSCRLFTRDMDTETRHARFVWCIKTIDHFNFEVTSHNMIDSISRFVSSIFYDGDNICTLDHNAVTFEFSLELLVGYKNITHQSVTIFEHGHPLLIELSEFWRDTDSYKNIPKRNLSASVFVGHLDDFEISPVKSIDGTDRQLTNVCAVCRSILWGENYVLTQVSMPAIAICPLCLHISRVSPPVEHTCDKLYSVKFPLSEYEMLLSPRFTDIKKDIMSELIKGMCRRKYDKKDIDVVRYILIGDKYLGFSEIEHYLFTKVSTDPRVAGRKVCIIHTI